MDIVKLFIIAQVFLWCGFIFGYWCCKLDNEGGNNE